MFDPKLVSGNRYDPVLGYFWSSFELLSQLWTVFGSVLGY